VTLTRPTDSTAHWATYITVNDVDEAASKVEPAGGTVIVPPTDMGPGRFAVLQDPQGAVFSVIKMSVPSQ
jgi:predicted enzyme related to lactoylglutathione lyase